MLAVLELVNSRVETTAADVVANLNIGDSTARQYLRRLADEHRLIARIATGVYRRVTEPQLSRDHDPARICDEKPAEPGESDGVGMAVDSSEHERVVSDASSAARDNVTPFCTALPAVEKLRTDRNFALAVGTGSTSQPMPRAQAGRPKGVQLSPRSQVSVIVV